jgi:hypothetical protein
MVRRDRELCGELRQGELRVGGERLTRSRDEGATRVSSCRASGRDGARVVALERARGKGDSALDELVRIVAAAC